MRDSRTPLRDLDAAASSARLVSASGLRPFGGPAIECFIDVACNTPHLQNAARCLTGALATQHGICDQGAEASCSDDCYLNALGKAVTSCNDPNLGFELSKCGFDLAI